MRALNLNYDRPPSLELDDESDASGSVGTPPERMPDPAWGEGAEHIDWGLPDTNSAGWEDDEIGDEVAYFGADGERVTVRDMRETPELFRNHIPFGNLCRICNRVHPPINLAWF